MVQLPTESVTGVRLLLMVYRQESFSENASQFTKSSQVRQPRLLKAKVSAEVNIYITTGPGTWCSFQPPTDKTARIAMALEANNKLKQFKLVPPPPRTLDTEPGYTTIRVLQGVWGDRS